MRAHLPVNLFHTAAGIESLQRRERLDLLLNARRHRGLSVLAGGVDGEAEAAAAAVAAAAAERGQGPGQQREQQREQREQKQQRWEQEQTYRWKAECSGLTV